MTIEVRDITSEEEWLEWRKTDVTASGAAALLGIHPYQTPYQLWAEKTGKLPLVEQSRVMERGKILEPIAISMLARQHPEWSVQSPGQYYRDSDARLGATPDVIAYDPARPGFGIVQIKSVSNWIFTRTWRSEEGEVEPPMWIIVQAAIEAELTGATWCAVAALVVDFGIDLHVVDVPIVPELIKRVRYEVADFWHTLDQGRVPPADWKRDGKLYETLYQPVNDLIVNLADDNELPLLLDEREVVSARLAKDSDRRKEIKAILLGKLGGASRGKLADGREIVASRSNRKGYTVDPFSFIDLRIRKGRKT